MEELVSKINEVKESEASSLIEERVKEFEEIGNSNNRRIFEEMAFCVMTANFNAERCIEIQKELKGSMDSLSEEELSEKLKELGHRFPNVRAEYIVENKSYIDSLSEMKESFDEGDKFRSWLIENIKGLGMKEASHFLRNIGYKDVAIIDFHILDLLSKYNIIEKPDTLSDGKYKEIEEVLKRIADKSNLNLAELDLYLWYIETGKVLK